MSSLPLVARSVVSKLRLHSPDQFEEDNTDRPIGCPLTELLTRYCTAHCDLLPLSIEQYSVALNLVRRWAGPAATCDDIFRLETFRQWTAWFVAEPYHGKKRANRTVRGRRDSLLTLWEFAFDENLCIAPPPNRKKLPRFKDPKEDPVAWYVDEFRRIIAAAENAPQFKWWTPLHWQTMLQVMYFSGERFKAVYRCRLGDLTGNTLQVRACTTKDKKSGNHALPERLVEEIHSLPQLAGSAVPEAKRDFIWPFPAQPKWMRERYKSDILRPAGLPFDRKHLFHCIRRTMSTEMVNVAGRPEAQAVLRHTTPALLDRYVSDQKLRHKTSAADVLPSPLPRAEQLNLFESQQPHTERGGERPCVARIE